MEATINKTVDNTENDDIKSTEQSNKKSNEVEEQQQYQHHQQLTPPSKSVITKISPKSADSTSNKLSIITSETIDPIRSEQTSPIEKQNESDENISNQSLTPFSSQQHDDSKQLLSSPQIETVLRQYRFKIPITDFYLMLEDAVIEEKSSKQYRYLTGDFMRIFERHLEQFEKCKVQIQKRNNIVYDVPSRTSTVYIRINGDCKLCPRSSRVKFVFTIRKKPKGNEKFIDIDTKSRGNHVHNGVTIITTDITLPSTSNNNFSSQEENNNMLVTTTTMKSSFNNSNDSSSFNLNESTKSINEQLKKNQFSSANKNINFSNQRKNIPKKRKNTNTSSSQNENQNISTFNDDNDEMNLLNTSSASLSNFNEQLQTMITSTPPPPLGPPPHQQQYPSSLRFGSSSNTLPFPSIPTTSLADRVILSQLANQITSRIMIKLDQINLKVNQISDRLYELERKFENVDLPEFQHF